MMHADEDGTFRALRTFRQAIDLAIGQHQGRIFGTAGDSVIAEFGSPVEAIRAAVDIQSAVEKVAGDLPEASRMKFRIGINLGDVIVEGADLIGDGVNIASRLHELAQPGEICVSAAVHELVKHKPGFIYDDLGNLTVKNIADPIRVYRVGATAAVSGSAVSRRINPKPQRAKLHLAAVFAIAGLLAAGLYAGYPHLRISTPAPDLASGSAPRQSSHASIAVLPFENLSGDASQDYFADGLTEDMTLALGRFSDLAVIGRDAVQKYKGSPPKPGELSRTLNIRYVLQGSVRKSGDRVRVTAILSDTTSGVQLWSDRYDGQLKDVFAVQDDVTQKVIGAMAIKLSDIELQRSLAKPPEKLQAYDYLLRGRDYLRRNTRADNREARNLFEQAIALDPGYASAYAALAETRLTAAESGWVDLVGAALDQAEGLARKALELDSNNAQAHAVLGDIYLNREKYDLARAEDDEAIALNPNDAHSHAARGGVLLFSGEAEEAVKSLEVAMRLDPSMESTDAYLIGWAYYLMRRYADAAHVMERSLPKNPDDYFTHAALAATYAQLGRAEDAARAAQETLTAYPFFSVDIFVYQFYRTSDRAAIADGLHKAGLK